MKKNKKQKNDLWFLVNNFFQDKREYFISIFSFILVILFGVVAKSFFVLKEYFWYFLSVFLVLLFVFIYFLREKKDFKEFFEIAIEEDEKLSKKIKEEYKDRYHIDFMIKILSYVFLGVLVVYLVWAQIYQKNIF